MIRVILISVRARWEMKVELTVDRRKNGRHASARTRTARLPSRLVLEKAGSNSKGACIRSVVSKIK